MTESKPILPKTVGLWTRPDSPRLVKPKNIFDYMDGAGELYLGYSFDHLEVYEYQAQSQKDIVVELYFMKSSDDAFGLLSLDWGGEPTDLHQTTQEKTAPSHMTWPFALYGEGLLRLWSDNIYARVMAYQETPESKKAVLSLSRSIAKERQNPPRPELLKSLPDSFQPNWNLRQDRASFFRSHLVLNSLYYLGQENMLDLDLTSEAVIAPYERKDPSGDQARLQLLLVRYADDELARKALAHFHRCYLPEQPFPIKPGSSGEMANVYPIEDGWLGYKLQKRTITFIFECPDQKTARTIIDQLR
ncbi:MAG: hypothetical protein GTO17_07065 [Candidatus Aminicenantes bacterium]|nr:hypothetical protein [Candidatus Aminicenantes bacterium]